MRQRVSAAARWGRSLFALPVLLSIGCWSGVWLAIWLAAAGQALSMAAVWMLGRLGLAPTQAMLPLALRAAVTAAHSAWSSAVSPVTVVPALLGGVISYALGRWELPRHVARALERAGLWRYRRPSRRELAVIAPALELACGSAGGDQPRLRIRDRSAICALSPAGDLVVGADLVQAPWEPLQLAALMAHELVHRQRGDHRSRMATAVALGPWRAADRAARTAPVPLRWVAALAGWPAAACLRSVGPLLRAQVARQEYAADSIVADHGLGGSLATALERMAGAGGDAVPPVELRHDVLTRGESGSPPLTEGRPVSPSTAEAQDAAAVADRGGIARTRGRHHGRRCCGRASFGITAGHVSRRAGDGPRRHHDC